MSNMLSRGTVDALGTGAAYPLAVGVPSAYRWLLDDIYINLPHALHPPHRIVRMFGFDKAATGPWTDGPITNGAHDVDIIMNDDVGMIFDTRTASYFRTRAFGTARRIHFWYSTADGWSCWIVQRTVWRTPDQVPVISADTGTISLPIDGRCVGTRSPASLGITGLNTTIHSGSCELVCGYNFRISAETTTIAFRHTSQLTFAAEPGAGAGRYPGCASVDPYIRTINHIEGDSLGNFKLSGDDCHWVRQPLLSTGATVTPYDGTLQLGNDCVPCTDCSNFEDTQRTVLSLWDRLKTIAQTMGVVSTKHQANINRWNEEKVCREAQPVTINGLAHHTTNFELAIVVCNHSATCLTHVILTVELRSQPSGLVFSIDTDYTTLSVTGRGQTRYQPDMTLPVFPDTTLILRATIDSLSPHGTAILRLRGSFAEGIPSPTLLQVTAYTNLTNAGGPIPPVVDTISVN